MTPSTNVTDRGNQVNGLAGQQNNSKNFQVNTSKNVPEIVNIQDDLFTCIGTLRLIKKDEVLALFKLSKSTFYVRINNGLMPPSVPLGERAVAFVQHEIQLVLAAQVAGRSNEEIKQLVSDLVSFRQDIYERAVKSCNM